MSLKCPVDRPGWIRLRGWAGYLDRDPYAAFSRAQRGTWIAFGFVVLMIGVIVVSVMNSRREGGVPNVADGGQTVAVEPAAPVTPTPTPTPTPVPAPERVVQAPDVTVTPQPAVAPPPPPVAVLPVI